MADRYWVGGTANWDGTAGAKWATVSGGGGGASVPTTADNVFLDAASGAGTVTVAVGNTGCFDLTCTGFTGSLAMSTNLSIHGSLLLVAGMTFSGVGAFLFNATGTGRTITTGGKTLQSPFFSGAGGEWTLLDTLNAGTGNISVNVGSLITNGQTVNAGAFSVAAGTTISLGASTLNLSTNGASAWSASATATINAGTSTINLTASGPTFAGGGHTYNVVNLTSTAANIRTITGANTFATLTVSTGAQTAHVLNLGDNQVVTGTFTYAGNSASNRPLLASDTVGTARTVTAAVVSVNDLNFRDITGAGAASPFTGTRLGDCRGNSGITFTAAANKYRVDDATANWDAANSWALSSGGAGATNNFPLPQDTCVFDAASFSANGRVITLSGTHHVGAVTTTAADQTFTLTFSAQTVFYGNITLSANVTLAGSSTVIFSGRAAPQTITSAGKTFTGAIVFDSTGGTVTLADAFITSSVVLVTRGTLNMNGQSLTATTLSTSNTFTRSITSGGGTMTLTGNNTSIWTSNPPTNLVLNDALQVDLTYSGATGTRTILALGTEAQAPNFKVSAGTDTVTLQSGNTGNLDFTGFAGSWTNTAATIYGSLTVSAGMTVSAGANTLSFRATSGTKTITSNGKTLDFPVMFNGVGGTWQLADALTTGSTRNADLSNGTLNLNGKTLTVGNFSSSTSAARTLTFGSGGKLVTTSTAAADVITCNTTTNFTVNRTGGSIEVGGNTTNVRGVHLGSGIAWPSLTFTNTTANGGLDIQSSGAATTLKSLAVSVPPQTIRRTTGTTITIEDNNGFPSGTAGNLVTITSIGAASHTWAKAAPIGAGQILEDYLSISWSTATPGRTWLAGLNSTDGGNNSGWIFSNVLPPLKSGFIPFFAP